MLIVVGRVRCDAANRDALVAAAEEMQTKSRLEDGCIRYGFFAAVEDPLSFIAVEEWADRKALDRHFARPHLHEFASRLLELVSERPEVAIHEVVDTSAFPGPQPVGGGA
jgi:quinol monooxygenase YgiN